MTNNIVENILKLLKGEFIKFVFVGGISAIIEFSLLILFVEKMGVDYLKKLINDHPDSPFAKQAQEELNALDAPKP